MFVGSIIFMATLRYESTSLALYTRPESPRPITFYNLYLPLRISPILGSALLFCFYLAWFLLELVFCWDCS
jgi:hypothetical protein